MKNPSILILFVVFILGSSSQLRSLHHHYDGSAEAAALAVADADGGSAHALAAAEANGGSAHALAAAEAKADDGSASAAALALAGAHRLLLKLVYKERFIEKPSD